MFRPWRPEAAESSLVTLPFSPCRREPIKTQRIKSQRLNSRPRLGVGWVFIGKKISGFSPSLWPRPKIFFFLNYNSPLARPRPIAADHFLKPLSRLLDQRKEKDVQESLTKVSSFLWPKPKEMKEMVSRFAPQSTLGVRMAFS